MNGNDVVDVERLDLTERIRMRQRDALGIPDEPETAPAPHETPIERMRRIGDTYYAAGADGAAPFESSIAGRQVTGSGSTDHTARIRALRERLQR